MMNLVLEASSHGQAVAQLHRSYEQGVQDGTFIPFGYPMATYGAAVLILFFMIPSSWGLSSRFGRHLAFGLILSWHVFLIAKCRSYNASVGFGIGIVSAWGVLWSAVLLIFRDPKSEFKRIKSIQKNKNQSRRKILDAITIDDETSTTSQQMMYKWQEYPEKSCAERFWWTLDLLSNFRGFGWNWTISGLPSRPLALQLSLISNSQQNTSLIDRKISRTGIKRFDERRNLLSHNAWLFLKGYLALDLMKVLIGKDPYFWGQISCDTPKHLPYLIQRSWIMLGAYRLFVTMSMIWLWLRTIFTLGPLVFVGLLGPTYLGSSGEPWMYPDHYGNSMSNILNRGLAGWWGGWWHQSFRYAFQTGGDWIVRSIGLDPQSNVAQIIRLFAAFSLSGFLHASGSITMLGNTSPWSGTFLFFVLQSVGILIEMIWRHTLKRTGLDITWGWFGKAANFAFAHFWLWLTAPLLANDLARGGLLLMEPVVFSPLRGLGFGAVEDGFYCWQGSFAKWHSNRSWWLSGFAL